MNKKMTNEEIKNLNYCLARDDEDYKKRLDEMYGNTNQKNKQIEKIPLYNEEPDSLISVFNELAAKINVIITEINTLKLENNEC